MSKKLYAIFHGVDEDGGFGDAVYTEGMVGVVEATEEEIDAFIQKWNKPIVYDEPYAELTCHNVHAEEIKLCSLDDFNPYGKGDYYGRMAEEHRFREDFEAKYGRNWNLLENRDELQDLYFKGLDEIRLNWNKEEK